MKKLKIESLFRICILIIINLFIKNLFIFILSLLFLINKKNIDIFIFIILFLIISLNNNCCNDYIKYGFVDSKEDKYAVVNKIMYKCRVYDNDLLPGDIVYFDASSELEDINSLKNNIKFKYKGNVNIIGRNNIKFNLYKIIDSNKYSDIFKSVFYNISNYEDDDFENLSYNLGFYYLLILLFRKNRYLSIIFLFIYSIIFGFQIKFILILINFIISFFDLDKTQSFSIKLLLICLINKYFLFNYSILISLLFSSINIFSSKSEPLIIGIIQSLMFGEARIFSSLFYKIYYFEKIFIFILASFTLLIPGFSLIFSFVMNILNIITPIFNISIRGKISLFIIVILYVLLNKLNIKNIYLRYVLFILIMLIPYNLFISHISFIDVGQGDSILINDSKDFKTILIDTGSKYNYYKLKKELFNEGIYKIDYLIITHDDNDHNGNIDNLYKDFKIINLIKEGEDIDTSMLYLEYLYLNKSDNDNDNSLVYMLYIDSYKCLLTGDISKKVENNIIFNHNINDVDILKVSHHGSNSASSSYFIGNIKPEFAIIQTNGMYNHPHKEVIDNLNKFNVNTFVTKDDGTIKFYFTRLIDYIKTSYNQFVIINK